MQIKKYLHVLCVHTIISHSLKSLLLKYNVQCFKLKRLLSIFKDMGQSTKSG